MRMIWHRFELEQRGGIFPSQVVNRELNHEHCVTVFGRVRSTGSRGDLLAVAAVSYRYGVQEITAVSFTCGGGRFSLFLPPGQYHLFVFADLDGDSVFTNHECVGLYRQDVFLTVADTGAGVMGEVEIFLWPGTPLVLDQPISIRAPAHAWCRPSGHYTPGTIRSIDDTIFSASYAELGIYHPARFLSGSHLYFHALRERDPRRMPVLFVHGYGGTPQDFRGIVTELDTSRYDIWFFYYPTGLGIERSAAVLNEIFFSGGIVDLRGKRVTVIAHSMGGLVVRRALGMAAAGGRSLRVDFISLCTPFGGVAEAAFGAKHAPVVISCWREMAPGSDFLSRLYASPMARGTRHFLFFAYRSRSSRLQAAGDGLVSLSSQLFPSAQEEAFAVFGFNETHSSIMGSGDVNARIAGILERPDETSLIRPFRWWGR